MSDFDLASYRFELPENQIAAYPRSDRTAARLMVVDKTQKIITHHTVADLPGLVTEPTLFVANNTKVFKARLNGYRPETGGKVEFFLLKRLHEKIWQGLMKTGRRIEPGFVFHIGDPNTPQFAQAKVIERIEDTSTGPQFIAEFSTDPVSADLGQVPLPPYILARRSGGEILPDEIDAYNTVYAKGTHATGSVAAPTAGRHFTQSLLGRLQQQGHTWAELTLHVGIGTFKPVSVADIRQHVMHPEYAELSWDVANLINTSKTIARPVCAIGTTSARTLEGVSAKTPRNRDHQNERVQPRQNQWVQPHQGDVNLFVYPGFQWQVVDQLWTNFHLPESTLLMMISSFIGDRHFTLDIYNQAVREGYQFFSYGDVMWIR